MTPTIRLAHHADIPRAAAVHIESCLVAYRGVAPDHVVDGPMRPSLEALWAAETLPAPDFMVVAEAEGAILGLAVARPRPDGETYVEHVHLRPDQKGRGLGRRIMARLIDELAARGRDRFHLHVTHGNDAALAFYRAIGGAVEEDVQGDLFGFPVPSSVVRWRGIGG